MEQTSAAVALCLSLILCSIEAANQPPTIAPADQHIITNRRTTQEQIEPTTLTTEEQTDYQFIRSNPTDQTHIPQEQAQ